MFLGSYEPSFDLTSRRIALPKKIREYLATSQIILSYGFEKCIFGYDTTTWKEESQKQLAIPITTHRARDLRRFFFSGAESVVLDNQGRFVIPSNLLNWAQIARPVIIGAGDHFEIWEESRWQVKQKQIEVAAK